jgi:hypothetical protein
MAKKTRMQLEQKIENLEDMQSVFLEFLKLMEKRRDEMDEKGFTVLKEERIDAWLRNLRACESFLQLSEAK